MQLYPVILVLDTVLNNIMNSCYLATLILFDCSSHDVIEILFYDYTHIHIIIMIIIMIFII